jgi:hypothetical protein
MFGLVLLVSVCVLSLVLAFGLLGIAVIDFTSLCGKKSAPQTK